MKIAMVMPSYWSRKKGLFLDGDSIYDHPTPLDCEGTIKRAIESISILEDKEFELIILGCATSEDIRYDVEQKIRSILRKINLPVRTRLFSYSNLDRLTKEIDKSGCSQYNSFLKLDGYSNIRNMCIIVPHILDKDTVVFIDDDEVFSNPNYIQIIKDTLAKEIKGKRISGIAGYYTTNGDWHIKSNISPLNGYFDKPNMMNSALQKLIGDKKKSRIIPTSYALGGNMALRKELYTKVHFDQKVTRGEDMDYVINAKMFGETVYFHNRLTIEHKPPKSNHTEWLKLRMDIIRFVYEYRKLTSQIPIEGLKYVKAEELGIYPGHCLTAEFIKKLKKASNALTKYYGLGNNKKAEEESQKNCGLIENMLRMRDNPFNEYVRLNNKWIEMMNYFEKKEIREKLGKIIN